MAARAAEPTCDAFITTVPYTINAQGHYCLANNVALASGSENAITINANSVVLDLKGYKIGGQAAGVETVAYGVYVNNHSTVVIRNGLIRGFWAGIYFDGGDDNNNNIVEDIVADSNTAAGIFVGPPGKNNTVRNCVVGNTGGSTVALASFGIYIDTQASFATNNTITGTAPPDGDAESYGLWMCEDGRAVNNQVIGHGSGDAGATCFFFAAASAIYKDNIASQCGTSYNGGTPVGTTNHP